MFEQQQQDVSSSFMLDLLVNSIVDEVVEYDDCMDEEHDEGKDDEDLGRVEDIHVKQRKEALVTCIFHFQSAPTMLS